MTMGIQWRRMRGFVMASNCRIDAAMVQFCHGHVNDERFCFTFYSEIFSTMLNSVI